MIKRTGGMRGTSGAQNQFYIPNQDPFKYDPDTGLQLGLGYDDVIKTRQVKGLVVSDKNEVYCKDLIDELIEELGYLDYRDFLACNKYVLEAARSQEAHVKARATFLNYAIDRLGEKRKDELRKKWREEKKAMKDSNEEIGDALEESKL